MQKKVHMAFGITCALLCLVALSIKPPVEVLLVFIAGVYVASSIPDFDLIIPYARHRGLSHSLLFFLIFSGIAVLIPFYEKRIPSWLLYGLPVGYLSHLIADTFTVTGVAWFQPVNNTRFAIGVFNTGHKTIQTGLSIFLWALNGFIFKQFFL